MTKRTASTQAKAANAIRADLKQLFPTVKFSVRSESFSGGDAVRITWTDGPTDRHVEALTSQYVYGSFDGMQDLYELTNSRKDIPQVKYITTSREYSQPRYEEAVAFLNNRYGTALQVGSNGRIDHNARIFDEWATNYIHRVLYPQSLHCPCGENPLIGDAYCAACGQPLKDDERRSAQSEQRQAQEAGIDAYIGQLLA